MAVQSIQNQYLGINAHLHSRWQSQSGWGGFHTNHISDLFKALIVRLVPLGYTAEIEESLQIRRVDFSVRTPRSDILIGDPEHRSYQPQSMRAGQGQWLPVEELIAEDIVSDTPYRAIVIYELRTDQAERGDPVARIELLSPSNKVGQDADDYQHKRMEVLHSGLVYVEIDYLHETPPTLPTIPNYRTLQGAKLALLPHAYRVILIDPRPRLKEGRGQVIPIQVDTPLPTIAIPLRGEDAVELDLGQAYAKTFTESLYGMQVDYRQLPVNFDRYSPEDQARIARRMLAVCEAATRGDDLERGPFAIDESITLEMALAGVGIRWGTCCTTKSSRHLTVESWHHD